MSRNGGYRGTNQEHRDAGVSVAAKVLVNDAPGMTTRGRKAIAKWLHDQAEQLLSEGSNYSKRFKATYFYNEVSNGKA